MVESNNSGQQPSKAPYFVMLVFRAFAFSMEVFLHRDFGARAIGLPALVALLLIPFWSVLWPQENPTPLLGFWWLYVGMCVFARTSSVFRRRQGFAQHSFYTGWPRLKWVFPWCGEIAFKRFVEPMLVFSVGVLLLPVSQVLGSYLMAAAFALGASVTTMEAAEQARAQQMHDALISQRQAAERFRRMSGDWS